MSGEKGKRRGAVIRRSQPYRSDRRTRTDGAVGILANRESKGVFSSGTYPFSSLSVTSLGDLVASESQPATCPFSPSVSAGISSGEAEVLILIMEVLMPGDADSDAGVGVEELTLTLTLKLSFMPMPMLMLIALVTPPSSIECRLPLSFFAAVVLGQVATSLCFQDPRTRNSSIPPLPFCSIHSLKSSLPKKADQS